MKLKFLGRYKTELIFSCGSCVSGHGAERVLEAIFNNAVYSHIKEIEILDRYLVHGAMPKPGVSVEWKLDIAWPDGNEARLAAISIPSKADIISFKPQQRVNHIAD